MKAANIFILLVVTTLVIGCDSVGDDSTLAPPLPPDGSYATEVQTDASAYDSAEAIRLEVTNLSSMPIYYPCEGMVYLDEQPGPTWKVYGDESCTTSAKLQPGEIWAITLDLWSLHQSGDITAHFGEGVSYRLSVMIYSDQDMEQLLDSDLRLTNNFSVVICPETGDGYVDYFPIEQGDILLFDFVYTNESIGGQARRIGDLEWTVSSTQCAAGTLTYQVLEVYSGVTQIHVDGVGWVDTGTEAWEKELVFVKGDSLELGGYTRSPIPWRLPVDSPEIVTFDEVIDGWPPGTLRHRLKREEGLIFRSRFMPAGSPGSPTISSTMTRVW